jgi:hypothetical protein
MLHAIRFYTALISRTEVKLIQPIRALPRNISSEKHCHYEKRNQ